MAKVRKVCERYGFVAGDVYAAGKWPGDKRVDDAVEESAEHNELPPNVVRFTAGQLYRDVEVNVWNGRGRRPRWIVQALENSASVDDFKVT